MSSLIWIMIATFVNFCGYDLISSQSTSLKLPSCGDLSGFYFDGICYWITPTYQDFTHGTESCKTYLGHPVDDLTHSNWSCIASRLSRQMNFFIGYWSYNAGLFRWDGNEIIYIDNMHLMWLRSFPGNGCAGYGSNGFSIYDCTNERQMLCVSTNISFDEPADLDEIISEIRNELVIDKQTLSSDVRRKTSATDSRQSSAAIGYLGIILISVVCGIIILFDIMTFIQCF